MQQPLYGGKSDRAKIGCQCQLTLNLSDNPVMIGKVSLFNRSILHNLLPWVTGSYACGSFMAFHYPLPSQPYRITLVLLAISAIFTLKHKNWAKVCGAIVCTFFFFATGLVHTSWQLNRPRSAQHIDRLITQKTTVTVVGTIATMVESDPKSGKFNLDLDEILIPAGPTNANSFQPALGTIRLSVFGLKATSFQPGTTIIARAELKPISSYRTPGAFNYTLHMATKGIHTNGWVKSPKHILPLHADRPSLLKQIRYGAEALRQQTALLLQQSLPPTKAAIYQALLIGYRGNIPPPLIKEYKHSGIMHLLAISGLHLGLLGTMTAYLLIQLGKRSTWILNHTHLPTLAVVVTFPILLAYSFLAGMNTPVLRALTMALLTQYALLVCRQNSLIHIISAAGLTLLVVNPLILATASFQLSFAAVISIAIIFPALTTYTGQGRLLSRRSSLFRLLVSALAISLAATIGTLPILLFHFNHISLIGPVMNLLLEPLLCFWALPAGLAAVVMSIFSPESAKILLQFGSIGLTITEQIVSYAASFSPASLRTVTPFLYEVILYYGILFAFFHHSRKNRLPIVSTAMFGLLLLSLSFLFLPVRSKEHTDIHILDVGKGNAVVIRLQDGRTVLIDGGGSWSPRFNIGKDVIAPFLAKQRIRNLDAVIVSHPDADHYNGIASLLEHYLPDTLYINNQHLEMGRYHDLMTQAGTLGIPTHVSRAGEIFLSTEQSELHCLGMNGLPGADALATANDNSLVVLLRHAGHTFLFPGDISKKAEKILIQKQPELKIDVLMAAHHGSKTSSGIEYLQTIRPRTIVISSSTAQTDNNTLNDDIEIYRSKGGVEILETAVDGTVSYRTDGKKMEVSTYTAGSPSRPPQIHRAVNNSPSTH